MSAYLPLNLEPETERQIERVLILADEPVLKRPFAVALVELALAQACKRDKALCAKVKKYLERYSRDFAVTHASATGSITHSSNDPRGAAEAVVPNQHGLPRNSDWEASAQGFVQPSDYFLASAGAVAYSGRTVATGSMLSAGFNWAQLDVGYRDHWFSPAIDSPMMVGTDAPTMPSVTLSNYEPLTRFGFQYEFFLAQMSRSDHILGGGQGTQKQSSGNPKLFGAQLSIEPFSGWSFGVNRQLQYGGGGLPDAASTLFRNFFRPGGISQTQGNQEASYVTRFIYPGKTPFALYAQYAGENNLNGGSYLLGEAALTVGIDFPRLWHYFDLTYETSEWQNAWYVNNPFLDGMTNDKLVLGSWGGLVGEVVAGRDVFGQSFSRLSGFVRFGGDSHTRDYDSSDDDDTPADGEPHTELFVDGGGSANKVRTDLDKSVPITTSKVLFSPRDPRVRHLWRHRTRVARHPAEVGSGRGFPLCPEHCPQSCAAHGYSRHTARQLLQDPKRDRVRHAPLLMWAGIGRLAVKPVTNQRAPTTIFRRRTSRV